MTLTNINTVIATAVLSTGAKQELQRGGIIAIVDYPPATPTASLPQDAAAAFRGIHALRSKYPQFAARLNAAETRWNNSLEAFRQTQHLIKTTPIPSQKSIRLEVDGAVYEQVVLTSFDGGTVGIAHASGVAGIPATKLKPEQIVALNATSKSVRIDPNKITVAVSAATTPSSLPPSGEQQKSTQLAPDAVQGAENPPNALLGDSEEAFILRYGNPITVVGPANERMIWMRKNDFEIKAWFVNGKATAVNFAKTEITEEEAGIILGKYGEGNHWLKNQDPLTLDRFNLVRSDHLAYATVHLYVRQFGTINSSDSEVMICAKSEVDSLAATKREELRKQEEIERQRNSELRKKASGL